MYPILFYVGSIPIYGYYFFVFSGFLFGYILSRRLAAEQGFDHPELEWVCFVGMLIGVAGGKLLYLALAWRQILAAPASLWSMITGSGMVFYGSLLAVLPYGIWYARRRRLRWGNVLDFVVIGYALGEAIGRLGCLCSGCCYGRPTDRPWGIIIDSGWVPPELRSVPLHPTQLYSCGALLLLTAVMVHLVRRRRFEGQVFLYYCLAYPLLRSTIEIFRGDRSRLFVIENVISTSQFISLLVFCAALGVLWLKSKRSLALRPDHG